MKLLKSKKVINLILIYIIVSLLFSFIVPAYSYAEIIEVAVEKNRNKSDKKKFLAEISNMKSTKEREVDIKSRDFGEYIYIQDKDLPENKIGTEHFKEKETPEYTEFLDHNVKQYKEYYEKFNNEYQIKYNGSTRGFPDDYIAYLDQKKKDYKEYALNYISQNQNNPNPPDNPDIPSDDEIVPIEITPEEAKKAQELLEPEDVAWYEKIFMSIFEGFVNFVAGLGDAVINVMQGVMLPGSPTAVARRKNTILVKEILDARNDNSYIYSYVQKSLSSNVNGDVWVAARLSIEPVPFIYYSPAAIFSNTIPALDINFIDTDAQVKNPFVIDENNEVSQDTINKTKALLKATELRNADGQEEEEKINSRVDAIALNAKAGNTAGMLQNIISKWYIALRNIAIVGLLIVLIYIGIRILISTTGEEQAKYKKMIKNWIIAIVLVILIHYIMAFSLAIVQSILNMFANNIGVEGDNLMNRVRSEIVHYARIDDWGTQFGFALIYLTMIWYIIVFTWQYLKRVIFMAFLTIISPLVALTYPLDTIKDGHSQAFNMWFKEYIFNVLLQPIHLLLYTVLVSSAIELTTVNMLYGVVAIGFLMQAEKFMKQMFDFKAKHGAAAGGFAAGSVFSSMMSNMQKGTKKLTSALQSDENGPSGGNSKVRMNDVGDRKASSSASKDLGAFANNGQNLLPTQTKGTRNSNPLKGRRTPKILGHLKNGNLSRNKFKRITPLNRSLSGGGNTIPNLNTGIYNNRRINTLYNGNKAESEHISFPKKFINGIGRVNGKYTNAQKGKKLATFAARTLAAGTLGMIGVSAGLASGNLQDVLKLGGAGVAGGLMLGKEAINHAESIAKGGYNAYDSFNQGYYGKEYNDKKLYPKLDKKWYNSEETKRIYMKRYGSNWKQKREEALKLRQQGITDEKQIEAAIKLKDQNPGLNIEQAGNIMKFKDVTRSELMEDAKREKIENQVTQLVGDNKELALTVMGLLDQRFNIETPQLEKEKQLKEKQRRRKERRSKIEKEKQSEIDKVTEENEKEKQEEERILRNEIEKNEKEIRHLERRINYRKKQKEHEKHRILKEDSKENFVEIQKLERQIQDKKSHNKEKENQIEKLKTKKTKGKQRNLSKEQEEVENKRKKVRMQQLNNSTENITLENKLFDAKNDNDN